MVESDSLLESAREADCALVVAGYSYAARHREDNDVIGREDDAVSIAALALSPPTMLTMPP